MGPSLAIVFRPASQVLWFVRASLLYNHGVAALAAFSQRVRHTNPLRPPAKNVSASEGWRRKRRLAGNRVPVNTDI